MRVIGFNFTKLLAEKLEENRNQIKIGTEIDVSNIKSIKADIFKAKEDLIEVKFSYNVEYDPKIAKVELEGSIIFSLEPKLAKQVLKDWKKKKMPEGFRLILFNVILKKSTLKALELEDFLNVPLHISLPSLKKPKDK